MPTITIASICFECEHYEAPIAKCRFYLRRCSTAKLWRGEIDPPEECPNKEAIEEAEPLKVA